MDLHEFIRMTTIINRLAKRALFAEKQMVALEGQCLEWKRIADELKAKRDAAKQEAVSARQDAVTRAEADRKRIEGLMIQVQDMRAEIELNERYAQTPKQHPVKVGEWVRRTGNSYDDAPYGFIAEVHGVRRNSNGYTYTVIDQSGHRVNWSSEYCEPCEPPEATHAEPDLTQLHAKGKEAWAGVPNATEWVEEMRGNTEATHDTEAGKAAAESAAKTEPVADEIKVGDLVEVYQATAVCTRQDDIGSRGIVEFADECVSLTPVDGFKAAQENHVGLCDVRKVTT